jgi:phenylalanyl-tRNA synthetase alpha chain
MNTRPGTLHPLSHITHHIVNIFTEMGFSVALGPEMETEWNNFDALNVPQDHPARDMQDTFWVKTPQGQNIPPLVVEDTLGTTMRSQRPVMRTHTSPVQIRFMQNFVASGKSLEQESLAIIAPGKVFRNEATDATHEAQFHQIEGLVVGKNITMAHLKGTLLEFFRAFMGPETEIRLRPSFFPFVEPGLEVDVKMPDGKWVEMLGAGLVHPHVLHNCGIDAEKYSGFAFGMGIDRLVMLKTGIHDVRFLYQGDARINQW